MLTRRALEHDENGKGDHQTDDRVGERKSHGDPYGSCDHGQRREPVGPRVEPVGDECRRPDPSSHPDAVERDQFVAEEPDETGDDQYRHVGQRPRIEQAKHRLVRRDHRGKGDHRDDEDAREVLAAAITIGVAPRGRSPAEHEGDEQRDRGQRIGKVVHGVGEQRDRPGDHHDDGLCHGGGQEHRKADLHGANACGAGRQAGVDRVRGVVAVRPEDRHHGVPPARRNRRPCPWPWRGSLFTIARMS